MRSDGLRAMKKQHPISRYLARYGVFGDSTLNFCNFALCGGICKITCYIALKHHNGILNIAYYFLLVGVEQESI